MYLDAFIELYDYIRKCDIDKTKPSSTRRKLLKRLNSYVTRMAELNLNVNTLQS